MSRYDLHFKSTLDEIITIITDFKTDYGNLLSVTSLKW